MLISFPLLLLTLNQSALRRSHQVFNRTEQILLHENYTVSCDITYLYKSNWNFIVNSGTGLGCFITEIGVSFDMFYNWYSVLMITNTLK